MTLYLDTSSLIKLYVAEPGSDAVRGLVDAAGVVATSIVAYAEARAALARLRRDRTLSPAQFLSAKAALDDQWPLYLAVDVTPALTREAGEYAERYALRGFDSLHLASFAEVRRHADGLTRFSSYDAPLNRAAMAVIRRS